jgi:hypothetical protein
MFAFHMVIRDEGVLDGGNDLVAQVEARAGLARR